ncbi:MAG: protein jag [Lachnospiraceae bacterium]|nr:protein jag [Lachnospiraceae bacterium]
MNEWIEVTAKTVDDAIIEAGIKLGVSTESMEYEVIEKESSGFLGLNKKPAKIRARVKEEDKPAVEDFLCKVFEAMGVKAEAEISFDEEEKVMNINLTGDDMGMLIGKRGQTLDSLQYLVSLVANKDSDTYIKVKLDTENYRERRKETLENLAKNIANKVRRTRHSVALEPMNPYERRIIHSVLQNNKFVETHSEGEEPYRKVIVSLKKGVRDFSNERYYGKSSYGNSRGGYSKGGYRNGYRKYDRKESSAEATASTEAVAPAVEDAE